MLDCSRNTPRAKRAGSGAPFFNYPISSNQTVKSIVLSFYSLITGEQRLHATFLGSSDDGNNSDCYDARQSPPKAIVDSSPLQPAMDKNKECE